MDTGWNIGGSTTSGGSLFDSFSSGGIYASVFSILKVLFVIIIIAVIINLAVMVIKFLIDTRIKKQDIKERIRSNDLKETEMNFKMKQDCARLDLSKNDTEFRQYHNKLDSDVKYLEKYGMTAECVRVYIDNHGELPPRIRHREQGK